MEPISTNTAELGKATGSPSLPRGRKAAERANVARCDPFTSSTIWVTLGKEWMGDIVQPFMFFPGGWHSRLLVASAFSLQCGIKSVLFTVVLFWEQPKTLPDWHMLVGEERTEWVSKQTGRQE